MPPAPTGATGAARLSAIAGLEQTPAAAAEFVPAFAFVYITLAVIGMAEPAAARSFAILVAVGDVLTNGSQVFSAVGAQTSGATAASVTQAAGGSSAADVALGPLAASPATVRAAVTSTVSGTGTYVTPSGRLTSKRPTGSPSSTSVTQAAKGQGLVFNPSTDQYVPA